MCLTYLLIIILSRFWRSFKWINVIYMTSIMSSTKTGWNVDFKKVGFRLWTWICISRRKTCWINCWTSDSLLIFKKDLTNLELWVVVVGGGWWVGGPTDLIVSQSPKKVLQLLNYLIEHLYNLFLHTFGLQKFWFGLWAWQKDFKVNNF